MSCFSAVSLLSLLPRWAQSFLPRPDNGGKETERTSERAASDITTSYTRTQVPRYKIENLKTVPDSKYSTASSNFLQLRSIGFPDYTPPSVHGSIISPECISLTCPLVYAKRVFLQIVPVSPLPPNRPNLRRVTPLLFFQNRSLPTFELSPHQVHSQGHV